jgi:hypothetical protein
MYFWQVMTFRTLLWQLGEADLPWLFEDLTGLAGATDQRMVFNAIVTILTKAGRFETELPRLRSLAEDHAHLQHELASLLSPPSVSPEVRRYEAQAAEGKRRHAEQEQKNRDSWTRFQQRLRENPEQLRDRRNLTNWKAGAHRLWDLTRWLAHRAGCNEAAAPKQWRLLEEAFGRAVAEAYRDGLKIQWRMVAPKRPKRKKDGAITITYANVLAFGAVGVEAGEDANWALHLTDDEARRAALHGGLTEQGFPEWVDALIASHPQVVLPVIRRNVRDEYLSGAGGLSTFLYRYGRGPREIHPAVQKMLFNLIVSHEPGDLHRFDYMVGMVERIDLAPRQRTRLFNVTERRLTAHRGAGRDGEARWSLAILLLLDFKRGLAHLETWLSNVQASQTRENAERIFAFLFDPHRPTIPSALCNATVPDLERLLRVVYAYIRPEVDAHHRGSYTPDTRDHAENARNSILSAILSRPGPDAYHALRRVAEDPAVALRAARFRELARGKAERDAELPAWTPKEVLTFERQRTAPTKSGADLLRVVEGVLKDIQFQFARGDASSRRVLQRAEDEDEVQNWLVEQMKLRARDRFRAFREVEVAEGDKPDVIVASTSASCEVAIEVKHGKRWTVRQLDYALRSQLAEDYLKPESRRHGVLVITHHRSRQWRDIETNALMTFESLIEHLAGIAATVTNNAVGDIQVRCIGIDSSDPSSETTGLPKRA